MSKINLNDHEWTELVFVGKNKNYGAYELRSDSVKRHNRSMLFVVMLTVIAFSLPRLISMVKKPIIIEKETNVRVISTLTDPQVKHEPVRPVSVDPPPTLRPSIKFTIPKIAKDEDVNNDDQIRTQDQLNQTTQVISIADVVGNDPNGKNIEDVKVAISQEVPEIPVDYVEQMPEFPGGEEALISYVGKNVRYPVISQETGTQGHVVVRFVVSKTGEVEKAMVMRSLDKSCDQEALRVVMTLPKWVPGRQNGIAVPVYYTLPITFKLN